MSRHLGEAAMAALTRSPFRVSPDPPLPDRPPTREELLTTVSGASALICLLTERIDREVLNSAGSQLRVVATMSVGTDNVDLQAAAERGVVVTNTPDVLTESTADLTMALLLAVCRRVVEADAFLRDNAEWTWGPRLFLGHDLSGRVLGIVGYGRIGSSVAKRARAFGMDVIATGRSARSRAAADGIRPVELPELLEQADVVSLHCPLTPATRHLIGAKQLAAMKQTAVLINTSRGPLVDETALVAALTDGQISGAGLDVFEREPLLSPGLRELSNVVITPHIGSAGKETRDRMGLLAVRNVLAVLNGQPALTPVAA